VLSLLMRWIKPRTCDQWFRRIPRQSAERLANPHRTLDTLLRFALSDPIPSLKCPQCHLGACTRPDSNFASFSSSLEITSARPSPHQKTTTCRSADDSQRRCYCLCMCGVADSQTVAHGLSTIKASARLIERQRARSDGAPVFCCKMCLMPSKLYGMLLLWTKGSSK
jgi:hypothetical protein